MGDREHFKPQDYPGRVQWEYAIEDVEEMPSRQYAREIARRIPRSQWGSEDDCCPHPQGNWPARRFATWRDRDALL